jgi:hypothetical protein
VALHPGARVVRRNLRSAAQRLPVLREQGGLRGQLPRHDPSRPATQWDTERNGERTPRDVTAGSNIPAWWRCPVDPEHRWEKPPSFRTGPRSYGCPFCVPVQWSKTELRLAAELACFTDVRTDQRLQLGRKIVFPDILLPELEVAVEFDGSA